MPRKEFEIKFCVEFIEYLILLLCYNVFLDSQATSFPRMQSREKAGPCDRYYCRVNRRDEARPLKMPRLRYGHKLGWS